MNRSGLGALGLAALGVALALALAREVAAQSDPGSPASAAFGERSLHLLHVPFLAFGPADPEPLEPGRAIWIEKTAYASTFSSTWHALTFHKNFDLVGKPFTREEADKIHRDFPEDRVFLVEGDLLRTSLAGRYGLTSGFSSSVEIVYISHDAVRGGSAVESFHRAFGLPQSGRDEFPSSSFIVLLQRPHGEITFDDRTPASGFGDTTATLSWRPPEAGNLRYGADAALKAPTGSAGNYDGSGSWDGGALGFLRWSGERWIFDSEGGLVVPGRWKSAAGLETSPFARLLVAASRRFGERTRVGASATFEQSPFRRDRMGDLSRIGGEIALGVSHEFPVHWDAALTLVENLPSLGDRADFGLVLRLKYR